LSSVPQPKQANPIFDVDEPSKKDELIESLQTALQHEIDARREERWIWLVAIIVVFNALVFAQMNTWTGPLMIGLIEIIALIAVGRRWQMDHIWTLTEKLVDKWDGKIKG
jgi:hypothetical protein